MMTGELLVCLSDRKQFRLAKQLACKRNGSRNVLPVALGKSIR